MKPSSSKAYLDLLYKVLLAHSPPRLRVLKDNGVMRQLNI